MLNEGSLLAEDMVGQCRQVVLVLQAILGVLAVGLTLIQVLLALRVSRYGHELRRLEAINDAKDLIGMTPAYIKIGEKKKYVVLE